jgi:2-polyprenyl-6-methoxyphenol hydroxylase-like FAD-dependent oxidoreductase
MKFEGIVSDEEWDRFAKAEGTRFPHCQYSKGMAVWDKGGKSGVVLVGDAIHAFPPDIGQ